MEYKPDRGRIEDIALKKTFIFNLRTIDRAIIEIDHINYGLNLKTGRLNIKKRSNFTVKDIVEFLKMLDHEEVTPSRYKAKGKIAQFEIRINCPINGPFYGREFKMIFDTYFDEENLIRAITLIPGWR